MENFNLQNKLWRIILKWKKYAPTYDFYVKKVGILTLQCINRIYLTFCESVWKGAITIFSNFFKVAKCGRKKMTKANDFLLSGL